MIERDTKLYLTLKRCFDLVLAFPGFVLLLPVFAAIGVAIKLDSPGPILYRAKRVGKFGKPFFMLKFRTMVSRAEQIGGSSTPENDTRITGCGRWLRKWKLDELPQLFNVLSGHMSIVGPRPQVQWAVDQYSSDQMQILCMKPGITDLASLRFPNEGEILRFSDDPDRDYMLLIHPGKMKLSLEYMQTRTLWLDLRIVLSTVWKILR